MGVIDEAVLVAVLDGQHAGTAGATDGVGYEAIDEYEVPLIVFFDYFGLEVDFVR